MRIFNEHALRTDISMMFRASLSNLETLFLEWVEKVWMKDLHKRDSSFLHLIRTQTAPTLIEGLDVKPYLVVRIPGRTTMKLDTQTEWDLKDSQANLLFYYEPSSHTLEAFKSDIAQFRTYMMAEVLKEGVDVRKFTMDVTARKCREWHEHQAVLLQRRLAAEAEERKKQLREWTPPSEGKDWRKVCDLGELNGTQWVLVQLMTQKSLDWESENLKHCVHSYGNQRLYDGETILLSVRAADKLETPVCTGELFADKWQNNLSLVQLNGISNHNADQSIPGILSRFKDRIKTVKLTPLNPSEKPNPVVTEADGTQTFRV